MEIAKKMKDVNWCLYTAFCTETGLSMGKISSLRAYKMIITSLSFKPNAIVSYQKLKGN